MNPPPIPEMPRVKPPAEPADQIGQVAGHPRELSGRLLCLGHAAHVAVIADRDRHSSPGLLSQGATDPERIWASGPREERALQLREAYGIHASTDNLEAVANADLVVLSVPSSGGASTVLVASDEVDRYQALAWAGQRG